VTADRLLDAAGEPENWLMQHGTYDGHRYSALDAIDRTNASRLRVLYSLPLGGALQGGGNYVAALPVNPLVADGYIYLVEGTGKVVKIDAAPAATDRIVWEAEAGQNNLDAWLQARRGLAFHGEEIISIAADGSLHWLDANSGELVRSVQVADPATGYSIAAPPLVVGDVVIVGGSGAQRGARGQLDGLDANTGSPLWRTSVVPEPGQPGAEGWAEAGDEWLHGGGAFSQTGVYDPDSGLTVWSAGGSFPFGDARFRPGSSPFTNSAIAVDAQTGELAWAFQYLPGPYEGLSESGPVQIVPTEEGPAVAHFGRNGFYYVLDLVTGAFRSAEPYVPGIAWTAGIDAAAGVPVELMANAPADPLPAVPQGCPNIRSVPEFAASYSDRTGLSYGAGAPGCDLQHQPARTASNSGWLGAFYAGAASAIGSLAAADPETGEVVAEHRVDFPLHAGAVSTAGGLVFTTTADGTLHALNDETLEPVWAMPFASLTASPPITFAVGGTQLIAVIVGGNSFVGSLSYKPREMTSVQPLFVLAVLGLRQ
jgi:alcohol dehydrogenase (cytochrome c)